jgi:hypothetical protein
MSWTRGPLEGLIQTISAGSNLWRDMIKEWRPISRPKATAAVLRRFADEEWIHTR